MLTNSTSKWKRFSGASYASFQSLHREVRIGVLSVAMLSSVALKANTLGVQGETQIGNTATDVDSDSIVVGLEDVEVLATRVPLTQMQAPRLVTVLSAVDIAAAAVHSINDLLEYAIGVDVRQRGEFGIQTDISVRGGTFDQITLLLNGVNISSPHTGHLSADFPVAVQDIERIEIIEGPSARVFGTSAFTGVVNVVTKTNSNPPTSKLQASSSTSTLSGQISLLGGSYGYGSGDLSLYHSLPISKKLSGHYSQSLSGGYSRADGATPNSYFQSTRGFYQGQYIQGETQLNLQLGYSYKPYAANTFYGASSTDQWESNERYMAAFTAETQIGKVHFSPALSWNRWFDHYQWHKGSPAGENYHQVDTWAASLNSWIESKWGKTSVGVEMRNEGIYSTKLGNPLDQEDFRHLRGHDKHNSEKQYTNHASRNNVSAFIEHNLLFNQLTLSFGLLANMNTALDNHWRFYPGVDVAYRPSHNWKLFATWNMALRMPTFTDLYYSGANIEGNSNLKPERTSDFSLGARFRRLGWKVESSFFYSHKSDMIDWVIYADELAQLQQLDPVAVGIFRSGNFKLDNIGAEFSATYLPQELWTTSPIRKLCIQYACLNEDISYDRAIAQSKYAMEYLRHKVVLQAESRLWKSLNLSLSWRWQDRVGEGNLPYALLDGRLSWDADNWNLYASCSNLLNKNYFDYSFIPQPGRWGKIGCSLRF